MVRLLKLLLTYQFKSSQPRQKTSGFTLIELLVGLALAFLVIIPLLGFMINIMDADRKEQAKASSEQDLQAALSYMARDLEQSVYIYDQDGIAAVRGSLPQATDKGVELEPVLVFWKRQFLPNSLPIRGATNCTNPKECDDSYVYSLVAYFTEKDPAASCAKKENWSCTTQIRRFQIKDGVPRNTTDWWQQPDDGFQSFTKVSLKAGVAGNSSLEKKMNSWVKDAKPYKQQPEVLIDYIDQSIADDNKIPYAACPADVERDDSGKPILNDKGATIPVWTQVPAPANTETYSFYACTSASRTSAQVFLRGNALARIRPKTTPPKYVESQSAYFPKASIQVQGRGLFNNNENK